MNASNADAAFHNAGSIWLFYPKTSEAQAWLDEHCALGPHHQYSGHALVVEARYVTSIYELATADGLTVEI